MRPLLATMLLLLHAPAAFARFTPVMRVDAERRAKQHARVYVAEPFQIGTRWYLPGESFVATHVIETRRHGEPIRLGCKARGSGCALRIRSLSTTRLDYSFLRKQTVERLARDLVRDVPRLGARFDALFRKVGYGRSRESHPQFRHRQRYLEQLIWIIKRLRRIYYNDSKSSRREIAAEGGWLKRHGETFITRYIGERSNTLKRFLWDVSLAAGEYKLCLVTYPQMVARQRHKLRTIKLSKRYEGVPTKLRGRMLAEDMGKLVVAISRLDKLRRKVCSRARALTVRHKLRLRFK
ncbi:MAG: hypothetical protein KC503_04310 [Myxococcales bacterium]|nr:hypothetical protein [Myxococcales bacterium]